MECFVKAAQTKSFSKAGAYLFISQQAVSRQMKALETELGFPLFERFSTGVHLTQEGEIIYQAWSELLVLHRGAVDKAKDLYYQEEKTIRIGVMDIGEKTDLVLDALIRYNERYPDLNLEYDVMPVKKIYELFDRNRLDMMYVYESLAVQKKGLHILKISEESVQVGIYLSRNHWLAGKQTLSVSDLQGETIGVLSKEASWEHEERVRDLLETVHNVSDVKLKEYSSLQSLLLGVLSGKCVTVIYEIMPEKMKDKLMFIPVEYRKEGAKIVLAWKEDKYTAKAKNIAQMIREIE
jgi:DNA-binding transcriptional LysR family regulator